MLMYRYGAGVHEHTREARGGWVPAVSAYAYHPARRGPDTSVSRKHRVQYQLARRIQAETG